MADRAVLCGINDYASISDLRGCLNDIDNVEALLIDHHGFSGDSIRTLVDSEVTRAAIESAFDWLVEGATAGDRLVFHFSGHGSYIDSVNDDEPVDELICLYDMDFGNPRSFLLDDDLGELARKAPEGVRLTMILDCCHSGTGTRSLRRSSSARGPSILCIEADTVAHSRRVGGRRSALSFDRADLTERSLRDQGARPVLARFVEPPERVRRKRAAGIRRLGARAAAQLDHQLLAGATAEQTAADAYIDGDYNGAFTYYLCNSARTLGGSASYRAVMDETVAAIEQNHYSQRPQCEGPFAEEPLFGTGDGEESEPVSPSSPPTPPSPSWWDWWWWGWGGRDAQTDGRESGGHPEPMQVLDRLLRVSEKLVDLGGPTTAGRPLPMPPGPAPRTAREVLVYVHGISTHDAGYSDGWFRALRGHLSRSMERKEVLWSRHVNPRVAATGSRQRSAAERRFEQELLEELGSRAAALERRLSTPGDAVRLQGERGDGLAMDDFIRYMTVSATRREILAEFRRVVFPLLQSGHNVHLIAHSWGTVVAYEGLRALDGQALSGRVRNLFCVGGALSIGVVRRNLFERVHDGRRPAVVERVVNIDAGGDIVGGPIGEHFHVNQEVLGTKPTGCNEIPFTDVAWNPACAHASYFREANLEVNRRIFARWINAAVPRT